MITMMGKLLVTTDGLEKKKILVLLSFNGLATEYISRLL